MEKKVLVAVDDSRHSESAIRYAAGLHETVSPIKYVLFHVEPTISQYLLDEARTKPSARRELDRLMKKSHEAARALLEKDRSLMISLGVAEADVQSVSLPRKFGVAKDILEYGTALLYDAIIVGRRGISGLAETFVGSVSTNIVDNSQLLPIWLVDEKGPSRSVMAAVDGSASSLRAVDHLAFIFSGNPDVAISFFHIAPRLADFCPIDFSETETSSLEAVIQEGDKACIDRFYAHALKKLKEAGIEESQVHIDSRQGGFKVGKAVLDAFRKGKFGTLVVGRRGMDKKFFTGSVSRYLVNRFSNGSLWVVP
ncbi:universal stress protein [uncultured Desulfosarcina sp.]|uniref:universal stress protein n=1 Tax=uncultured Desulfosarcina sp. TaxID=218289 RepID=UPI0029C94BD6|nr:universal stress protein [uncultured Desulfosarcina sp.]